MGPQDGLQVELSITERELAKQLARAETRMVGLAKKWEADFAKANAGAVGSVRRLEGEIARTTSRAGSLLKGFAAGFVGAIGVGTITRFTGAVQRAVGELSNLAKRADLVSIDVESFQGLQRGLELAGVEQDKVNTSLTAFARRIGEAANGAGPLAKTVERYGIRLRDANGQLRPQIDLLRQFADVIGRAGSDAERLAIADAAFSETGRGLALALRGGGEGIDRMIAAAREAGTIFDEGLVRRAEELDDRLTVIQRRVGVGLKSALVEAGDAFFRVIDAADEAERRRVARTGGQTNIATGGLSGAEASGFADRFAQDVDTLITRTVRLQDQIDGLAGRLGLLGQIDGSASLRGLSDEIAAARAEFEEGSIDVSTFARRLAEVRDRAETAIAEMGEIDGISFAGLLNEIALLGGGLTALAAEARAARAEVAAIGGSADFARLLRRGTLDSQDAARREARNEFLAGEEATNAKTRERLGLEREIEKVRKDAAAAGAELSAAEAEAAAQARIAAEARRAADAREARGGGGRPKRDEVAELLAQGEREIAQMELRIATIGLSEEAVARLVFEERALAAARRENLDLDQRIAASGRTLREEIAAQADEMARLTAEVTRGEMSRAAFADAVETLADGLADVALNGGSLRDVMNRIWQQMASDLLRSGLRSLIDGLFDGLGGGGGGGILGSIFGSIFGGAQRKARGGTVRGPGGPTGDRIPALLSDREFVVNARSAQANLPLLEALNASRGPLRLAAGGLVGGGGGGGGGESPLVQIVNNTGETPRVSSGRGPDGREMLRVEIGRQIGRGEQDRAMSRFGVTPPPVRR